MSRTAVLIVPLSILLAGGTFQVARPLPALEIQSDRTDLKLPGSLSVAFPDKGQTAIGEMSLGVVAETPHQEPVPIASVAKIMTAYLLLQAQPLKPFEDGPRTTITPEDVLTYEKDKALGYSVAKVKAGDVLTERQLLEALMLPSGDNIATLIANQLAGSEAKFANKMNEAAKALGMTRTTYEDASGVDPGTVSTAQDQILLAAAAMKDPVFRAIVAQPQADLPTAGRVYNVNFLVGKQGISGIKTGSTSQAGSCFVGSYPITVGGTPRIVFAAILGQQSLRHALTKDAELLHAVAPQFSNFPVARGGAVARIKAGWDEQADLNLAEPLQVFGYPGMPVKLETKITNPTLPIEPGREVAKLVVTTGALAQTLDLKADQAIHATGFFWRINR